VMAVVLPPLRDRREDIPYLVDHFVAKFARLRGLDPPAISPAVRAALARYSWPGNVRELRNACERAVQLCTCGTVRTGCVAARVFFGTPAGDVPVLEAPSEAASAGAPPSVFLDDRLHEVEANLIAWALNASGGNKSKAAELLHVKRSTLGDRIARCGMAARQPVAPSPPGAEAHDGPAVSPDESRDDVAVH
jgi:DNA-binding NtrC family response regulator